MPVTGCPKEYLFMSCHILNTIVKLGRFAKLVKYTLQI